VNEVFSAKSAAAHGADVQRLRRLRRRLERAIRELRIWIDLLRNKAVALRAISAAGGRSDLPGQRRPDTALTPGSLDPELLADALAAAPVPHPRAANRAGLRVVQEDTGELLRKARVLWETVADPDDPIASHDLADAADRLADRLEQRWRVVRDEWRSAGDELARALAEDEKEPS
jgi:hypothetical protein